MKRLTKKDYNICNVCDRGPLGMNWNCDGFPACGEKAAYDRLAAYEDILGDEYDLDRLRELAQADRGEIQAVDVAPVAHAQWKDDTCTNCGYGVQPWNNTGYCPSCGARMDKEVNT